MLWERHHFATSIKIRRDRNCRERRLGGDGRGQSPEPRSACYELITAPRLGDTLSNDFALYNAPFRAWE